MKKTVHPQIKQVLALKVLSAKHSGRKFTLPKLPKPLRPLSIQREYVKDLHGAIKRLRAVFKAYVYPKLERIVDKAQTHRPRKDSYRADYSDDIGHTIKHAKIEYEAVYSKQTLAAMSGKIAKKTYQFNAIESEKQMKVLLGVNPFFQEPWLNEEVKAFTKENVGLISKWSDDLFTRAEEIITREARAGTSTKEIADQLEERIGVVESRYDMIARDQVSKFNGTLNELRQTEAGIEKYVWQTSSDERVRGNPDGIYPNADPSHFILDGKTFSWAEGPEETDGEHPSQPVNCRCSALPDMSDILAGVIDETDQDSEE